MGIIAVFVYFYDSYVVQGSDVKVMIRTASILTYCAIYLLFTWRPVARDSIISTVTNKGVRFSVALTPLILRWVFVDPWLR